MYVSSILLLSVVFSCNFNIFSTQCLSENDSPISETSVGSAVRNLIDGSLNFSLKLLKTIELQERSNTNSEGIFFSPFSIWSALMITYIGANGRTERQLTSVLGTGNSTKERVWDGYRNLLSWNAYKQVNPKKQNYNMVNKIFFQENTPVRDCVKKLVNSEIDFANFAGNPEKSRISINQWIEKETQNKIKELIPSGGIDALTKMVIANAVYFKDTWQTQFDPAKTKPRRFTLPTRRNILVNMMSVKGRFLYGISEELQCTGLELPYDGNDLSMLVLLPNNRKFGISALAQRLTSNNLDYFLNDMYPREVLVSLPKFKLEDGFELGQVLSKMGLRALFDSRQVDLSGFTGQKDLFVDSVYHKSFVDVNEEGTEAAAATSLITSRTRRPIGPASFTANSPFIFFIRDNVADVILFMGVVKKPPAYDRDINNIKRKPM